MSNSHSKDRSTRRGGTKRPKPNRGKESSRRVSTDTTLDNTNAIDRHDLPSHLHLHAATAPRPGRMLPTLALLLLLCHAASAAPAPYNATAAGAPRLYSETCVCPSSAPECKAEGFGLVGTKKCFQPHDIFGTSGVECTRDDGTAMACTHSRDEACHWSCDSTAIGNGICNQACSTAACLKDGGDCGESDPYTCSGCTALGYKWCPTAALCAKYTETVTARHGDRELCPEDAWVDACDAKYDTLSDPLYEPNQWVFDLVRVESGPRA